MSKNIKKPSIIPASGQFKLTSSYKPSGDQPLAIEGLERALNQGKKYQTLLGVTGSGKTFTMANLITRLNKPTLVMAPNKTLAAQLYNEFREFFPHNNVHYFVSYYDYYQPEAYMPGSDTYIEKDAMVNQEIDKLRHASTRAILEHRDTVVVSSVSCIYGLGAPEEYFKLMLYLEVGDEINRDDLVRKLVYMQYKRTDYDFKRGTFRIRGEVIDIFPSDQDLHALRVEFFDDEVEGIFQIDPITGEKLKSIKSCAAYPLSHFLTAQEELQKSIKSIRQELKDWLPKFIAKGKGFEAERLKQRTLYDLELMKEVGFCPGIENYSRHLAGRAAGEAPTTLIDYFPDDFLLIVDESHVTVSQTRGMYAGDQARKKNLVEYGFRLPSALDNRPLNIDEFWEKVNQVLFVSATPTEKELVLSKERVVEQVNRPTGLLDPIVEVKPATHQVDDLVEQINKTIEKDERVLVTVLTKRMAEDLSKYLRENGYKCRYLHSEINTIERVEIIRGLRKGDFDILVGINLLREGLDLVEVSLVAILDADKEGFLRSTRSLIQTIGRASRNINGRVILYGDKTTGSMQEAINETNRRREIQKNFNKKNGIIPTSAIREVDASIEAIVFEDIDLEEMSEEIPTDPAKMARLINKLRDEMSKAAQLKEFEKAAGIRDKIFKLEKLFHA